MTTLADGHGPHPSADPALLDALRADLVRAGFTVDGVADLLGPLASAALHREEVLPALRQTDPAGPHGANPRATLVRHFVLGRPVTRRALAAAAPALGVDGAARLGLVTAAGSGDDDEVRPAVELRPYAVPDVPGAGDLWVASDLSEIATGEALRTDHVLGIGGASTTLAQVVSTRQLGRVLDIGTGCGVQLLHLAGRGPAPVGTDISARALRYAGFNLALAGVTDHELRLGSMLDPVADGEMFDLVVSNPPFVITPRSADVPTYEYRDGGRTGDAIVADLVRGVGSVLAPGGVAQFLGNWEVRAGEDWRDRVGGWLDESGLDGWVIQRELQDPAEYAETWIRDGGTSPERDPAAWAALYGAWLDDFATRGVEGIGFGYVVLRRPEAGASVSVRRLEEITGTVRMPLGGHIGDSLAAESWLAARDDAALAAAHLAVAGDVTEERYLTPGAQDPSIVLLRQGGGLGRTVQVGTALAGLVGACDGELSVGQIVAALASLLDVPADALAADVLPTVRGLVRDGLLLPAER